jgi:ATP-dependent exoDNAse (exonuclease V) alpha subunit
MNLSSEQHEFIQTILDETNKQSVLLLGKAGVGKSVAMRALIDEASKLRRAFIVLAPTGVAAINVGGITVHRFLGTLRSMHCLSLDFILIDECSMVRADLFDSLDSALRRACNSDSPFGGVRLALVGDFAQLPPVVTREDKPKMAKYLSPYLFSSEAFPQVDWKILELTQIFRQKDPKYTEMLNDIREGRSKSHLNLINSLRGKALGTILCPTNALAEQINSAKLRSLTGEPVKFEAHVSGMFQRSEYPADEVLTLKLGARAMCIRNIYAPHTDYENGEGSPALLLTNGDVGIIEELDDGSEHGGVASCLFKCLRTGESHRLTANMTIWEKKDMVPESTIDPETGEPIQRLTEETVGSFSQIPLRLAWAVTIHKSQGMTLQEMTIDLTNDLFAAGQAYVALSRGVDLSKVRIVGELTEKDVIVCPYVADFVKNKMESKYIHKELGLSEQYEFGEIGE